MRYAGVNFANYMKITLPLLGLVVISLSGLAQIPRGTTYSGISALQSFTHSEAQQGIRNNGYGFSLEPSYGWFVINNLSVGVLIDGYGGTFSNNSVWLTSHTYSLGGGIFVRDYLPITSKVYGLFALDYGWQRGTTSYQYAARSVHGYPTDSGTYSSAANTFGVRGGVSWFMTRRTTLEATLGYIRRNHRDLDDDVHLAFYGPALEIGLRSWMFK
jgi:hypothetical protein